MFRNARRSRPSGLSIIEIVISLLILAASLTIVAQALSAIAGQRRRVSRYEVASQEIANVMEQVMAMPWEQVTTEAVSTWELSARAKQVLADAEISAVIHDELEPLTAKRIEVQVQWSQQGRPLRLVAWRYPGVSAETSDEQKGDEEKS